MNQQKRILVAPLDWGLGHASRCIPIIHELQAQGAEVIVGAANKPLKLLLHEFPNIEHVYMPGMNVAYPKRMPMSFFMARRAPKFLKWVREEQDIIQSIIQSYNIDGIISDNRYGLFTSKIPCVLITHQLFIKASIFSFVFKNLTQFYASKYNFCWIPDFIGEPNLSGDLSHRKSKLENLRFVGPLSRFAIPAYYKPEVRYDLLVVLSGPEPSRTLLENNIMAQLRKSNLKSLVVRGLVDAESEQEEVIGNITRLAYLTSNKLQKAILMSKMVLCRSGYSSIMDLSKLQKKAFFVPTNGQTEQEYLASKLMKQGLAFYTTRNKLSIDEQYEEALNFSGLGIEWDDDLLKNSVHEFLSKT